MISFARSDRIVRRHAAVITAASVAMLAIAALWTVDAATAVERLETATLSDRWEEVGTFTYRITVLKPSHAFPNGTVLGMGEAGYFTTISPRVDVAYRWSAFSPGGARVAAAASLELVVSSTSPAGRPYWTLRYPLANATFAGAGEDGLVLRGLFDFDRVLPDVENTSLVLGARNAKIAWELEAVVKYALEADAISARNASRFSLPIDVDVPLYVLPDEDAASFARAHGREERVVEERRAGLGAALARPGLALPFSLGAAGLGLVWRERRTRPAVSSSAEREYARDLAKHEEWITPLAGGLPEDARARAIDVPSVEALVAIAAESQRRVLLDPQERALYVVTPEACYRCRRHARKPAATLTIVGP